MNTLFGDIPVTRCQRCRRPLSNPESMQRGYGPVCWTKLHPGGLGPDATEGFADQMIVDRPVEQEGVFILRRDQDGAHTNVPHLCVEHSLSGFEWGYGGSGPSDLALNIIEKVLKMKGFEGSRMGTYEGSCFDLSWEMHHDFKRDVVCAMPRSGGDIPIAVVWEWVLYQHPELERALAE